MIANTGKSSQLFTKKRVKVDFTARWLCYNRNTFSPLEGYKQRMERKVGETLVIKIDPALRPAPTSLSGLS